MLQPHKRARMETWQTLTSEMEARNAVFSVSDSSCLQQPLWGSSDLNIIFISSPRRYHCTWEQQALGGLRLPFCFSPSSPQEQQILPGAVFPPNFCDLSQNLQQQPSIASPTCPPSALGPAPLYQLPRFLTGSCTPCRLCGRLGGSRPPSPAGIGHLRHCVRRMLKPGVGLAAMLCGLLTNEQGGVLLPAQVPVVPRMCKGGGSGKDLGSELKTIPGDAISRIDWEQNCQPEERLYVRISVYKANGLLTLIFVFPALRIAQ